MSGFVGLFTAGSVMVNRCFISLFYFDIFRLLKRLIHSSFIPAVEFRSCIMYVVLLSVPSPRTLYSLTIYQVLKRDTS